MSAAQILQELPRLSKAELRQVRQRLLELSAENQEIEACNQSALEGALMLDRMEEENASHQSR